MKELSLALLILFGVSANAQEPPQPTPDLVPNAQVVEGPISDLIERRIEAKLEKRQEELYGGFMAELATIRQENMADREERRGLLAAVQSMRANFSGFGDRISEFASNIQEWRMENQRQRSEWNGLLAKWTPLQNLVDRLTGLVWKLFWLMVALGTLGLFLSVIALIVWRKVSSLPSTIADAVIKN